MGALPPIAPWIPEDDLRLRNAVESGASLESLAKGAVRFSRRFSLQELQDRWQALLYDPDTAAQASTYMVELELSASSLSSNRPGDSKGNGTPAKRKEESVCSHYFAMRKRIHSEHFNNMDLSFFSAPNLHNCTDTGNGCQEQLAIHNGDPVGNSMLGGPVTDQFGLHDPTGFDMVHHGFQQVTDTAVGGMEGSAHAFPNRQDTLEAGISDGIIGGNCLYGYGQNVTVGTNEAAGNDMQHSFERDSMHQNIPHVLGENILGENISVFNDNSCVQEMRPPQAMTMDNLFVNASLKTESLPSFDPTVNSSGNTHSGFEGNQGFSPPVSESAAFHQLGCSPSVSTMRMWRTIEDISPPAIPANDNHDDKRVRGTMVNCGDDAKKMSASGFDRVHPDPHSEERLHVDELRSASAILEVSRYQYEETKRAIIRLEQGTHSCMQRAMTSYKAFAILYGRHLKHYIKKSEVLLGRATDDSNVDIDLTKEGRSNKISRRQALVKMEEDGSFLLKNLGKCSIFVNSKNVQPGHRIKLRSSCLIEIKSMRFVFEVNEKAVRQYVANIARKKQHERTIKFEWSPEGF